MVSVIIPVYNTERNKLHKCIESILSQTYSNFEIIVIDDGSNKEWYENCEKLKKLDSRICVYHYENCGVSSARNHGIDIAQGKYLFFCDADDYVEDTMLESMRNNLESEKVDLLIAGYYFDVPCGNRVRIIPQKMDCMILKNRNEIKASMIDIWDHSMMYNVWNKLFRMSIIKEYNIRFPIGKPFNEDRDFVRDYIRHVNSCYVLDQCYYHYLRENNTAATGLYRKNILEIRKEEYENLLIFFQEMNVNDYMEYVSREHLDRVVAAIENLFHSNLNKKQKKEEIKTMLLDDLTVSCMRYAVPKSKKMTVIYYFIKSGNVAAVYFLMECIYWIRMKYPDIFYRMRQSR